MKIDLKYLFSKTWFFIIIAGILGFIVYEKSSTFMDYLPSKLIVTVVWSAALMYVGLIVGFSLGRTYKGK